MSYRRTLPSRPSSIRAARRFVNEALVSAGTAPDIVGRAELVVSELATNALIHAEGDITVSIDRSRTKVRVEVGDAGVGQPTVRRVTADSIDGRGLVIVSALCAEWGVVREQDRKTVWCELATD
jgi:anti-sigma regulatory factor (Ser/Thr protein kinase)